jgi:KipI family sensor histidine kinase inhibitor
LIDEIESPAAWAAALGAMEVPGVVEIIPAETSVVVRCTRARHHDIGMVSDIVVAAADPVAAEPPLTIDVVYDGPDIAELATVARVSIDDVVRLHATGTYTVAFCGFSPGFGYLRGIDRRLHVPRRDTPRLSVPAGSVGIAAGYTCVYPSASPGGWYLIGHTTASLFDVELEEPAVLRPGRTVRFRMVPG